MDTVPLVVLTEIYGEDDCLSREMCTHRKKSVCRESCVATPGVENENATGNKREGVYSILRLPNPDCLHASNLHLSTRYSQSIGLISSGEKKVSFSHFLILVEKDSQSRICAVFLSNRTDFSKNRVGLFIHLHLEEGLYLVRLI